MAKLKIKKQIFIHGFNICLRLCSLFYPIKKNRVLLIRKSFSGSNITPIYEKIITDHPMIDVQLIDYEGRDITDVYKSLKNISLLLSSKVIVTTHGSIFKTKKNITLQLWHAFPTKKDGLFLGKEKDPKFQKLTDYQLSYSDFCTLLLNSRIGMPIDKYVVLGAPRNDYLAIKYDDNYHKDFRKVILYAPTFREGDSTQEHPASIFNDAGFSMETFKKYLRENNYLFIWKIHPNDESKINLIDDIQGFNNILLLSDSNLRELGKDFYQILPSADLLITDYSSVYVDFLLLEKPIIFTPLDLENYCNERGLLLTPYEYWHPGPICLNQEKLCQEINLCLNDQTYFTEERVRLKNLFHKFQDGSSSERVIQFILSKMEKQTR